jgi:hypothetical protein
VITGDASRMRRRASPRRVAIACASDGPSGENSGSTTAVPTTVASPRAPVRSTCPRPHSSSKFRPYAAATGSEWTRTTMFSSRLNASSVQLVDPVQTSPPSRTTYLWCIRAPLPETPRVGTSSPSICSGSQRGSRGSPDEDRRSTLKATRTDMPRPAAASSASATAAVAPVLAWKS